MKNMFNKYTWPTIVIAIVSFFLEVLFLLMALHTNSWNIDSGIKWTYPSLFLGTWALSALYGAWIQWIAAKYHDADGWIVSAGFGLQIPLLQAMTIYFTWRHIKR